VKRAGIEIALRAEERNRGIYNASNVSGNAVYTSYNCKSYRSNEATDPPNYKARWNYGFSIDTRSFEGTGFLTLDDFNITIVITAQIPIAGVQQWTMNAKAFATGLLTQITTCSSISYPFNLDGSVFNSTSELIAGGTAELKFLQESTNILFEVPMFPYDMVNKYTITLSLAAQTACRGCDLSVSIIVDVQNATSVGGCGSANVPFT